MTEIAKRVTVISNHERGVEYMAVWGIKLAVDICWYFAWVSPILVFLPSLAVWIGYGIPVVYAIYLVGKKIQGTVLQSQKDVFFWQCKLLGILIALELVFCGAEVWKEQADVWVICFLAFGILLLRMTRLGEEYQADKQFWGWNTAYLAGILLTAVLVSSDFMMNTILWIIQTVYFHIIFPVLMGILYVIAWLCDKIVAIINQLLFSKFQSSLLEQTMDMFQLEDTTKQWKEPEITSFPVSFQTILWCLAIMAVLLIIVIVYRKLLSASDTVQTSKIGSVQKMRIEKSERTRRRKTYQNQEGVQEGIRLLYQKFLRLYRQKGLSGQEYETSEEIQRNAEQVWDKQEMEKLRNLYVRERYGEEQIEQSEIDSMKRMFQRWKRERTRPKKM